MRPLFLTLLLAIHCILFAQLEIPEITKPKAVIKRDHYTLQYNEEHEQADWVAYELLKSEIINDVKRKDNFREDPLVLTGSASLGDYKSSGYDRGHLAPAADMKIDQNSMSDSFYMSNMSPQIPSLNRGVWKVLEALVRSWALEYGKLYVITGPVLNRSDFKTIGPNKVSIPNYFYKAVLLNKNDEWFSIGFILPNTVGKEKEPLESYIYTIDDIESILNFDLFPGLDDKVEESTESYIDSTVWSLDISSFPKTYELNDDLLKPDWSDTYWINSSSETRHNSNCKYFNNTKSGYFTDEPNIGKPCSLCGG